MRTSCITHPPKDPLIMIRQWQVALCEGNTTAAALLSFFEYWHNLLVLILMSNLLFILCALRFRRKIA